MKMRQYKDVDSSLYLKVRAWDTTVTFDICKNNEYLAPSVELNRRQIKCLIKFLLGVIQCQKE